MPKPSLKKSLSLSFFDKYVGYTLRFFSTIIIARLCSPAEIGIFSVAFVLISIGHVLRDFGVAQYLIREKTIDPIKIRASLTLMWMIAWGLWAVLWMTKGWVAHFYERPELEHAIEILSLIYLLAPFGSVRIALLRRDMDFKSLAKVNIMSYLALHVVSVALAYYQWGFYALVWGQVAGVVATLLGTLIYGPSCWHWPSFKGIHDVIRFGFPLCVSNIIETITEGGADLILGRTMNMQAVGIFGRAQGLLNLFKIAVTSAVWPVVLPYFSLKNREEKDLLPDYLKAIEIYTMFAWPFFLGLALFAKPIVLILFGEVWLEAVPLVRVLSLVALIQAVFPFNHALFIAKGEVNLNFWLQATVSLLRLGAVALGSVHSMLTVAYYLVAAECFAFFILYFGLKKVFSLTLKHVGQCLLTPFMGLGVLVSLLSLVKWSGRQMGVSSYTELLMGVVISLILWSSLLVWRKHPIYLHAQPILRHLRLRSDV